MNSSRRNSTMKLAGDGSYECRGPGGRQLSTRMKGESGRSASCENPTKFSGKAQRRCRRPEPSIRLSSFGIFFALPAIKPERRSYVNQHLNFVLPWIEVHRIALFRTFNELFDLGPSDEPFSED